MRAYLPTALRGLQRQSAGPPRRSHPWVMIWTLAVAQVISWGTLFYAFSLFVVPMQASLGWSRPLLNSAQVWWRFPSGPGLIGMVAGAS